MGVYTDVIVEPEVPDFHSNCALPKKSMTLSAYVLQTFLVMKSILANSMFFHFQTSYHDVQDDRHIDHI